MYHIPCTGNNFNDLILKRLLIASDVIFAGDKCSWITTRVTNIENPPIFAGDKYYWITTLTRFTSFAGKASRLSKYNQSKNLVTPVNVVNFHIY